MEIKGYIIDIKYTKNHNKFFLCFSQRIPEEYIYNIAIKKDNDKAPTRSSKNKNIIDINIINTNNINALN